MCGRRAEGARQREGPNGRRRGRGRRRNERKRARRSNPQFQSAFLFSRPLSRAEKRGKSEREKQRSVSVAWVEAQGKERERGHSTFVPPPLSLSPPPTPHPPPSSPDPRHCSRGCVHTVRTRQTRGRIDRNSWTEHNNECAGNSACSWKGFRNGSSPRLLQHAPRLRERGREALASSFIRSIFSLLRDQGRDGRGIRIDTIIRR
jgi:hypothetical protein